MLGAAPEGLPGFPLFQRHPEARGGQESSGTRDRPESGGSGHAPVVPVRPGEAELGGHEADGDAADGEQGSAGGGAAGRQRENVRSARGGCGNSGNSVKIRGFFGEKPGEIRPKSAVFPGKSRRDFVVFPGKTRAVLAGVPGFLVPNCFLGKIPMVLGGNSRF